MKKSIKYFIYFILVAPFLSKILEWLFQIAGGIVPKQLSIFIGQIIFIELLSIAIYFILFKFMKIKKNTKNLAFVVGISYFLKELWNLIFVYSTFNYGALIALTLEPVFMYTILGLAIPKLILKWREK